MQSFSTHYSLPQSFFDFRLPIYLIVWDFELGCVSQGKKGV
jgi:hypothetical protein